MLLQGSIFYIVTAHFVRGMGDRGSAVKKLKKFQQDAARL